jgi:LPXTG-motif cell wall-anchored protein
MYCRNMNGFSGFGAEVQGPPAPTSGAATSPTSGSWLDYLTKGATALETAGKGAKDIQSVLGKKPTATVQPIGRTSIPSDNTWMIWAALGLAVVGGGAYFLLRK